MTRFTLLLLMVVVTGVSSVAAQGTGQTREEQLKAAIAKSPTELTPYAELAQLYRAADRLDEAEQVLRQALKLHRDSGAVYDILAGLYRRTQPEKALQIVEEWIKVAPDDSKPYVVAAETYRTLTQAASTPTPEKLAYLDRALALLESAVTLSPDDPMPQALRLTMLQSRIRLTEDPSERVTFENQLAQLRDEQRKRQGANQIVAAPAPASLAAQFPNAVRIGGGVRAPTKIQDVRPEYPPAALEARVQGVVIIEAVIDENGSVAAAQTLRSIPLLNQPALDAVHLWKFTPTMVENRPVPVIMTVTVQFTLPPQ